VLLSLLLLLPILQQLLQLLLYRLSLCVLSLSQLLQLLPPSLPLLLQQLLLLPLLLSAATAFYVVVAAAAAVAGKHCLTLQCPRQAPLAPPAALSGLNLLLSLPPRLCCLSIVHVVFEVFVQAFCFILVQS
jgi:hypothetical protein